MDIKITRMTLAHLKEVMSIEEASFPDPWSQRSFKREISGNNYAYYLVAEVEEKVVAYVGGWIVTDELHITNMAVAKEYRKIGLAQKLIDAIFSYAREEGCQRATLEVRVSNFPAIELYKKKGFVAVGTRPKYYSNDNEDALIMWKSLSEYKVSE